MLGLTIADWLYRPFPDEPEGKLSRRLNALVSRGTCAEIAPRARRRARHMRLGKQALADGAFESDNVLGDVVEALIGALWLDGGLEAARGLHPRRLGRPRRQPRQGAQASQIGAAGMGRGQQRKAPDL